LRLVANTDVLLSKTTEAAMIEASIVVAVASGFGIVGSVFVVLICPRAEGRIDVLPAGDRLHSQPLLRK
jgi:hypothetical protein